MVEAVGRVGGQVKNGETSPGNSLGESLLRLAKQQVGCAQRQTSCKQSKENPSSRADPLVVDGPFEEEGDTEHQRDNPDAIDQR